MKKKGPPHLRKIAGGRTSRIPAQVSQQDERVGREAQGREQPHHVIGLNPDDSPNRLVAWTNMNRCRLQTLSIQAFHKVQHFPLREVS